MDYTLKKIAELAQINVSSARYYRDLYESYFTTTGEGRNRRYSESNIALLKSISKMYSEGMLAAQIVETLDSSYGIPVTRDLPVVQENTATQQDILNEVRNIFKEEIKTLEDKVDALAQGSQERDARLMETMRAISEKNQKKGWRFWR